MDGGQARCPHRRAAVRPTCEASNTLAAVHSHARGMDEVYERALMTHVKPCSQTS
jgi:hypothetical protein